MKRHTRTCTSVRPNFTFSICKTVEAAIFHFESIRSRVRFTLSGTHSFTLFPVPTIRLSTAKTIDDAYYTAQCYSIFHPNDKLDFIFFFLSQHLPRHIRRNFFIFITRSAVSLPRYKSSSFNLITRPSAS